MHAHVTYKFPAANDGYLCKACTRSSHQGYSTSQEAAQVHTVVYKKTGGRKDGKVGGHGFSWKE